MRVELRRFHLFIELEEEQETKLPYIEIIEGCFVITALYQLSICLDFTQLSRFCEI